jgi:thiol:disulfide interchange protein DsbD
MMLIAWITIAIVAAVYLALKSARNNTGSPLRWIAPLAAAGIGLWLANGARGTPLGEVEAFLPPSNVYSIAANKSGSPAADLEWILNDHPRALTAAAQSNRLVFVDFTGYTCTNCRWMESNMFSRPEIAGSLSRYVLSRLFTDGEGAMYERQQKFQEDRFGTVALPLYAIVDAQGNTIRTFSGLTRSPAEFLAFLQDAS